MLTTLPGTALNIVDAATDGLATGSVVAAAIGGASKIEEARQCAPGCSGCCFFVAALAWCGVCLGPTNFTCLARVLREVVSQSVLPFHVPLWAVALFAWCFGGVQMLGAAALLSTGKPYATAAAADLMGFETFPLLMAPDADAEELSEAERKEADGQANGRTGMKFLFRLFLENIFQLHLQITTLGLSLALVGWDDAARNMVLSIALSSLFLIKKLVEAAPVVGADLMNPAALVGQKVCSGSLCICTTLLVAYAAAKFWALFGCPQHLLNVTGCAELDL
mmetsp:Transcript_62721/g.168220  ORF Transcript_62721/g.168220 Transcript_62721/m.168220 type:complete len:279 (-) Transcript_62721:60-896(-)